MLSWRNSNFCQVISPKSIKVKLYIHLPIHHSMTGMMRSLNSVEWPRSSKISSYSLALPTKQKVIFVLGKVVDSSKTAFHHSVYSLWTGLTFLNFEEFGVKIGYCSRPLNCRLYRWLENTPRGWMLGVWWRDVVSLAFSVVRCICSKPDSSAPPSSTPDKTLYFKSLEGNLSFRTNKIRDIFFSWVTSPISK